MTATQDIHLDRTTHAGRLMQDEFEKHLGPLRKVRYVQAQPASTIVTCLCVGWLTARAGVMDSLQACQPLRLRKARVKCSRAEPETPQFCWNAGNRHRLQSFICTRSRRSA